jgi:hypothetical protein
MKVSVQLHALASSCPEKETLILLEQIAGWDPLLVQMLATTTINMITIITTTINNSNNQEFSLMAFSSLKLACLSHSRMYQVPPFKGKISFGTVEYGIPFCGIL